MFGTVDFSLNFNGLQVKHAPLQNLAKKKKTVYRLALGESEHLFV